LSKNILWSFALLSSICSADLFQEGNVGLGIVVGSGTATTSEGTQNYTLAGVGVDYFIVDDMSVGLGYMGWFGASPSLNQVTVSSTYYLPADEKYHPYFGAFLRETFMSSGYEDYESYGAKVGLAVAFSKKSYLAIGIVQEFYANTHYGDESSTTYPEIVFAFSF